MKKIVCALLLLTCLGAAHALAPDSPATAWNSASASEKSAWAGRAAEIGSRNGAYKYHRDEVASCLSTLVKRPVPALVASMSLSDATAGCLMMIPRQR